MGQAFRFTTLNLRHGGSSRVDALADWLVGTNSDVLVCSEMRLGSSGDRLSARLSQAGYIQRFAPQVEPGINTVAIFARSAGEEVPLGPPEAVRHRITAIRWEGLTVVGVYFPTLMAKRPLFDWLLGQPHELDGPTLMIGDFNTGLHHLDENGATFLCASEFARLPDAGWTDAWRRLHGEAREFTWYSSAGNGFRLDHAFVSKDLAARLVASAYDHSTRPRLSDHSALTIDLSAG